MVKCIISLFKFSMVIVRITSEGTIWMNTNGPLFVAEASMKRILTQPFFHVLPGMELKKVLE